MMHIFWYLRLLLFYAAVIPATILITTCGWICSPLPDIFCYKIITSWSHFFMWWAKIVCGLKYNIVNREKLPKAPFVVLCNHQSMWETIFMQILLPPQSWVLKRELLWIPFFGWGLALIKPIAIDRNSANAVKKILNKGLARIADGRCVIFYPEGTRVKPGEERKYSRSGAALAIASKVPIVPIAHNSGNFWPRGPWIKQPGTITVCIGNPIATTGADATTVTENAHNWIDEQKLRMDPPG